ncbi:MAG: ABC transporter substrate-binding protein [Spirochaetia bacterium]|jgi:peptide/nickel transport system substrate-binding protein|nr:ABC transporter substrate-binding protein [Spirochaetales bacterium]MDX9785028.1 ABC transporter substrate-binding protein [Spirochaetia bacterium]
MIRRGGASFRLVFMVTALAVLFGATASLFAQAGSEKDPLVVIQSAEPTGLDPVTNRTVPAYNVTLHIFDSLLLKTPDGQTVPALAESYVKESDTSWLFKLRSGVTFHNGEALTADAVKYTIDEIFNPANKSTRANDLNWIDKVTVVDKLTVRITGKKPFPLADHYFSELQIVPPLYREKVGAQKFNEEPVGTGPYQFVRWDRGNRIVLKRNDNYWKAPASAQFVEFQTVSSAASRVATLLGGKADLIVDPPVTAKSQIDANPKTTFASVTGTRVLFVGLDVVQDSPLKDVRVRQALNYAVDKKTITSRLIGLASEETTTLLTSSDFGFTPEVKPYPYDPKKARQLLADAGYPNGFSIKLDATTGRYINDSAVVQAIAGYLGEVGVKVELNILEFGAFNGALFSHKTSPMYFVGWGNPVFDASYVFNFITKTGSLLRTIEDPAIDKLLNGANETTDKALRKSLYAQAGALINESAPAIFLYKQPVLYGLSSRMDWKPRSDEFLYIYDAKLR